MKILCDSPRRSQESINNHLGRESAMRSKPDHT